LIFDKSYSKNKKVEVFWDKGYIAPKSKIKSKAHYAPQPTQGKCDR